MKNYNEGIEEGKVSEWNEALFKMKRLHELQSEINVVKMNPLSKHYVTGRWNFDIWFNSVVALYYEGQAKYTEEEVKEIDNIKSIIESLLETKNPYRRTASSTYSGRNKYKHIFREENWKLLKKLIELLEKKVKILNDVHGLSTKNVESMNGKSILR